MFTRFFAFGIAYRWAVHFPVNRYLQFFAAISYPLYVVHAIFGYVALRILCDVGFPPHLAMLTVFLSAIGLALLIHWYVEAPTQRLGKRLQQRLEGRGKGEQKLVLPS